MSTPVIINGTTYNIPEQGQSPPWGSDLHDALVALVEVVNSSSGPSDILTTSFSVANNQSSVANVTGLSFSTSSVRGAEISYNIYRNTSTTEMCETGTIYISYKSVAGTWELTHVHSGSSGVTFTITNAGQIQYVSTNMGGTGYVGKMKFSARSYLQA